MAASLRPHHDGDNAVVPAIQHALTPDRTQAFEKSPPGYNYSGGHGSEGAGIINRLKYHIHDTGTGKNAVLHIMASQQ